MLGELRSQSWVRGWRSVCTLNCPDRLRVLVREPAQPPVAGGADRHTDSGELVPGAVHGHRSPAFLVWIDTDDDRFCHKSHQISPPSNFPGKVTEGRPAFGKFSSLPQATPVRRPQQARTPFKSQAPAGRQVVGERSPPRSGKPRLQTETPYPPFNKLAASL